MKKISEIGKARNCVQTGPFGSLLHAHDYQEEGFPLILVKHIKNGNIIENNLPKIGETKYVQLSKFILKEGDIVFTRVGYVGNAAYVEKKHTGWLISGQMLRIRIDNPQINNRFISYFFLTENFKKIAASVVLGSTRDSINTQILKDISIAIPAKEEQDKIASIINAIIKKIQCIEHQNKILEQIAQATFKSWFVDFEPVCTKIEHRWRPDESLPGLPTYLYNLFPNRLVDSELGEIPEGWEIKALSQWASVNPESWSRTNSPKKVEYVDLASTKWGNIKCTQHFLWSDAPSRAKRILRSGDTIVGTVRPANGSYSLITTGGLTGSTGFTVLRPINPLCREFVYLAVTFPENIERLAHRADGAAYPAVRSDVVGETKVVMPHNDHDILDHFSKIVAPLLNKAESNKAESRILSVLRDALLPKLISGEIRV